MKGLDDKYLRKIARAALDEDGAWNDATVEFLRLGEKGIDAEVVADEEGVMAGVDLAKECFTQVEPSVTFSALVKDGGRFRQGETVARLQGPSNVILSAERVALNFLQRMSGIASLTARFVDKVKGAGITILDTRKTTPLLRDLEKYAVRCGGGQNHRRDLESMVLVKENHIRSLGGTHALVEYLEAVGDSGKFIEVEIDSLAFLKEILGAPVNRVMLDNFKPHQVRKSLKIIDYYKRNHPDGGLEVEVSGGMRLKNISSYAIPGVDFISVGALTHSAPAITMSLEVL